MRITDPTRNRNNFSRVTNNPSPHRPGNIGTNTPVARSAEIATIEAPGEATDEAFTERTRAANPIDREVAEAKRGALPGASAAGIGAKAGNPLTKKEVKGRVIVSATQGNDDITVTARAKGGVTITSGAHSIDLSSREAKRLEIRALGGDDRVTIAPDVRYGIFVDGGKGNDEIRGSNGKNRIYGGDGDDKLYGGDAIDFIEGGKGNDEIHGGAGDDRIGGGAGDDTIYGDADDDHLFGDAGNDTIEGGDDYDIIEGGKGNDVIRGGGDVDIIRAGRGDDEIYGGAGNDKLYGQQGDDYIEGQDGNDTMNGGKGIDVMYGLDGNDSLSGEGGRDYLDGGEGNDGIRGGRGRDQVLGGKGKDRLRGDQGRDVLAGGSDQDVYSGGKGRDVLYHQSADKDRLNGTKGDTRVDVDMSTAVGVNVRVAGDAEFTARVESDLETYRSLPTSRGLLSDMDATGRITNITPTTAGNSARFTGGGLMTVGNTANGPGSDVNVRYNRSKTRLTGISGSWAKRPPSVGLFHELVHAKNANEGSIPRGNTDGVPNAERIAVGGRPIDHDSNAATPRIDPNSDNENTYRKQLGLPKRPHY